MKNFSYSSVLCVSLLSMSFGAFSAEGLNVDLAILKINKEVKSLNKEILTLKDEIEILRENQRLNSEKIDELLQMIELNQTNNKTKDKLNKFFIKSFLALTRVVIFKKSGS